MIKGGFTIGSESAEQFSNATMPVAVVMGWPVEADSDTGSFIRAEVLPVLMKLQKLVGRDLTVTIERRPSSPGDSNNAERS
jgi:hypothetical protein